MKRISALIATAISAAVLTVMPALTASAADIAMSPATGDKIKVYIIAAAVAVVLLILLLVLGSKRKK